MNSTSAENKTFSNSNRVGRTAGLYSIWNSTEPPTEPDCWGYQPFGLRYSRHFHSNRADLRIIVSVCFALARSTKRPKERYQRHQAFLNISRKNFHKLQMIQFGMKYFGLDYYIEVRKKRVCSVERGLGVMQTSTSDKRDIDVNLFTLNKV